MGRVCGALGRQAAVHAGEAEAMSYFAHFNTLLHLELLGEMAVLRRRRDKGQGSSLARRNMALGGLCESGGRGVEKRGRGGKKSVHHLTLTSKARINRDALRIKRGEGVAIVPCVAGAPTTEYYEGSLVELREHEVVVAVQALPAMWKGKPITQDKQLSWRLEKSANRVSYERQLSSLEQITHAALRAQHMSALLTHGGVGCTASWVQDTRAVLERAHSRPSGTGQERVGPRLRDPATQVNQRKAEAEVESLGEGVATSEVKVEDNEVEDVTDNELTGIAAYVGHFTPAAEDQMRGSDRDHSPAVSASTPVAAVSEPDGVNVRPGLEELSTEAVPEAPCPLGDGALSVEAAIAEIEAAQGMSESQKQAVLAAQVRRLTVVQVRPPRTQRLCHSAMNRKQ